ncbi:Cytochrome c [Symmachiella macrocystis]|uniref:Cytochrome c n=1 Tax=Symmachiella macrocystis TaxID=2527985 RepID=A0A5C6B4W1_9PLAN|nr:PVC-type heme-binding CxxCH protein [Symmachiella macrocystis]TWU07203.1 Cytochrome c [Symmachiella macrocystis]
MTRRRSKLITCGLLLAAVSLCGSRLLLNADEPPALAEVLPRIQPTPANKALKTFRLLNGFRLELLASEPLVTDPVAMQYDENGKAYVVEMSDYPYTGTDKDVAWQEQTSLPIGRVRTLEDTDGDGRFDKSVIFAEDLSWPTGLAFWKGGVFVTATPDVWYLKDTDGDGKADVRRKVFTGFRKFNVQAVMNNLAWGLDHKIYAAGSSNGGNIRPGDEPSAQPIPLRRNDFRLDPVDDAFEVISGGARFGNSFDDFGNRFICNIRNPAQHIVLQRRYLARNPFLAVQQAVNDAAIAGDAVEVFRISPPEPWRVINAKRLAADTNRKSPRSESVATGFVTSSSGITIYRGAAYPEEFYGNAFIAEVAGNLVMHYRLNAAGPTFVAQRANQDVEFLASTDNWFRPVNFVNAPDGTLHVLDMYRETIEHPWSIPDDIKAHLDLESGRDRGRIYRLAPPQYPPGHDINRRPQLGTATTAQLVAELENPNSWWRETAHRLIYERQEKAAIDPLRNMLRESSKPLARLHALWSLNGLEALTEDDLMQGLTDASPRVREQAVLLAENRLKTSPKLLTQVLAVADDDDARVRFQTALSLGEAETDPRITAALERIARRDVEDPWTRAAVLASLSGQEITVLVDLLADPDFAAGNGTPLIAQLAEIIGARNRPDEVRRLLAALSKETGSAADSVSLNTVASLGSGLKRARAGLGDYRKDKNEPASELIARLFDDAEKIAVLDDATVEQRIQAVRLLGYGEFEQVKPVLEQLIDPRQPLSLQMAAVQTLSGFVNPQITGILLERFTQLTPSVRNEVVGALSSRSERIGPLLDALEQGHIPLAQIPPIRRGLLLRNRDAKIKARAEKLFANDKPSPRHEVIAAYQTALSLPADSKRGEAVFRNQCTTCHRLGDQGHDVGMNLATIKNRTAGEILVHVLDPNREVSPNFLDYIVVTDDGRTTTGIIANETATSITLRRAEGQQETILRQNIDEITSSGVSLMPEGLEKKISPQQMADLLEFLVGLPKK